MKPFFLFLSCALATSVFAEDAKTNVVDNTAQTSKSIVTFSVSAGVVTAPLVLTNGIISQPDQTELDGGGKATYSFTITNAGDYVIRTVVNATDESANSFFLNIDAQPEDPTMIWDIPTTSGFEERTVSWRGNGSPEEDEFSPKHFNLKEGAHKLFIIGREPECQLKTITISPAPSK